MEQVMNMLSRGSWENVKIYNMDIKDALKWGGFAALGAFGYNIFLKSMERQIQPGAALKDLPPANSIVEDQGILDHLVQLQTYREVEPWLFWSAVRNLDMLLFLEQQILLKKFAPVRKDKVLAWTHFRVGINDLNEFQFTVHQEMGSEHGKVANMLVENIFDRAVKHLLNVMTLCSDFNPKAIIARAPSLIDKLKRRWKKKKRTRRNREYWTHLQDRSRAHRRRERRASRGSRHDEQEEDQDERRGAGRTSRPHSRRSRRQHETANSFARV